MGNGLSLSPCLHLPASSAAAARLVYWGGQARQLAVTTTDGGGITAGDVTAELPAAGHHAVCPADAFFIGLPVPAMAPGEALLPGRTYFVLPAARLPCGQLKALTPAALAALAGNGNGNGNGKRQQPLFAVSGCPFEHVKGGGGDGGAPPLIRVLPEFIEKLITCDGGGNANNNASNSKAEELCSTPELKRHYAQLVGAGRSRPWSPRLETIAERDRSRRWTITIRSAARTMLSSR